MTDLLTYRLTDLLTNQPIDRPQQTKSVDKSIPRISNTLYLIYMTQNTPESPIYLGFASQKGGVGKSSLAETLASILYYEKGIPLLVVDCDGTQESFIITEQKSICPRRIGAFIFLSTPKTSDHPHENENRTRPARTPCLCPSVHRAQRAGTAWSRSAVQPSTLRARRRVYQTLRRAAWSEELSLCRIRSPPATR